MRLWNGIRRLGREMRMLAAAVVRRRFKGGYVFALAIAAAIILAFVVSGNGSPVLVGRNEPMRAGAW